MFSLQNLQDMKKNILLLEKMEVSLSKKIDIKKNTDGSIKCCYLYMNSHYFTRREAISFNSDGWIGFAGWADMGNLNPIKRAFMSWCDELKKNKENIA